MAPHSFLGPANQKHAQLLIGLTRNAMEDDRHLNDGALGFRCGIKVKTRDVRLCMYVCNPNPDLFCDLKSMDAEIRHFMQAASAFRLRSPEVVFTKSGIYEAFNFGLNHKEVCPDKSVYDLPCMHIRIDFQACGMK